MNTLPCRRNATLVVPAVRGAVVRDSRWRFGSVSRVIPVALACLLLRPLPAALWAADAGTGQITGTVLSAQYLQPVTEARVTVVGTTLSAETDTAGRFSIPGVPEGRQTVTIAAPHWVGLRVTGAVVAAGRSLDLGRCLLNPRIIRLQQPDEETVDASERKDVVQLEEFVVTGGRLQPFVGTHNVDLPRTTNDVQPYYVFNRSEIDGSGATDVEDFFQRMVPMDASNLNNVQVSDQVLGDVSNINLGGLNSTVSGFGYSNGTQNTLLLVDGRRLPSISYENQTIQPDLNAIPLAALDHIEVLPASASAIYGGSAAGGVVNLVLRHDYSGMDLVTTYENTFTNDAPIWNTYLTAGLNLEKGKTNLIVTGSWTEQQPLFLQDRMKLVNRYENRYFSLFPGGENAYLGVASGAIYSSQATVISSSGKPLFANSPATIVQVPADYQYQQGLAPLQANVGNFNLAHPDDATFRGIDGRRYYITQAPIKKAVTVVLTRQMAKWLDVYAAFTDGSNISSAARESFVLAGTTVPANAPGNPFGQAVKVYGVQNSNPAPEVTDRVSRSLGAGAKFMLGGAWGANLDYTWGMGSIELFNPSQDNTTLSAAIANGTANVIADLGKYPIPVSSYYPAAGSVTGISTMNAVSVRAAGTLPKLWAGEPSLSASLEHRKEGNCDGWNYTTTPLTPINATITNYPGQSSDDNGAAVELAFPLVSSANKIFGVRRLDLQVAGRDDLFETSTTSPTSAQTLIRGSTITYTPGGTSPVPRVTSRGEYHSLNEIVGLRYKPIDDVALRASYSGGFAPPVFSQLAPPFSSAVADYPSGNPYPGVPTSSPWTYRQIIDPLRGNALYYVPTITGGNPNLTPETSKNFATGVILEPHFLPGLRVSLDFTRVTKRNNIVAPSPQVLVSNSVLAATRVQRAAPVAGDSYSSGPIVLIDATNLNAVESLTSSYIMQADYSFRNALGAWRVRGTANFAQHYQVQSTTDTPEVEYLANPNYAAPGLGYPVAKLKGNIGLNWSKGQWSAGWLVRYVGPYTVGSYYGLGGGSPVEGTDNGWVSSQVYHDAYLGYRMRDSRGQSVLSKVFGHISVQLGAKNIFDRYPPYDAVNGIKNFWYSTYGDIRLATYYVRVKESF